MIPCMVAALALVSCDKTMDDKAAIDAQYDRPSSATVSLTSAAAEDFQSVKATVSVSGESEIFEQGIQLCSDASFASNVTSVANDTIESSFTLIVGKLAEQTTYYVRGYAATKTGGIIVTEPQSVTTPKAPIFTVDGTYTATEWDYNKDTGAWENAGKYEVTITFDPADPTIVNITNIWGGGMTVQGQYDAETGIITVPNMQVIYVHNTYGDVWLRGIDLDEGVYTDCVYFQFTALGGKMESTSMAAQCGAGDFGYFYLTMEHQ